MPYICNITCKTCLPVNNNDMITFLYKQHGKTTGRRHLVFFFEFNVSSLRICNYALLPPSGRMYVAACMFTVLKHIIAVLEIAIANFPVSVLTN